MKKKERKRVLYIYIYSCSNGELKQAWSLFSRSISNARDPSLVDPDSQQANCRGINHAATPRHTAQSSRLVAIYATLRRGGARSNGKKRKIRERERERERTRVFRARSTYLWTGNNTRSTATSRATDEHRREWFILCSVEQCWAWFQRGSSVRRGAASFTWPCKWKKKRRVVSRSL